MLSLAVSVGCTAPWSSPHALSRAHLMSMSSCFSTFLHDVQKSAWLVGLGVLDTLKEERKERSKSKTHSVMAELKKRDLVEVKSK